MPVKDKSIFSSRILFLHKLKLAMFDKDDINRIVDILDEGGVILYPTDTIWGLGCDAHNEEAINKIYDIKQRSKGKPLSLIASSIEMIKSHVVFVHPKIETLLSYHERPLTVIYDEAKNLPENLVSDDGSIAIRLVKDEFCIQLIEALGRPIVSTSANMSNAPLAANFGQITSDILSKADYIVKHRQDDKTIGEPSVMIKLSPKAELIFVRN